MGNSNCAKVDRIAKLPWCQITANMHMNGCIAVRGPFYCVQSIGGDKRPLSKSSSPLTLQYTVSTKYKNWSRYVCDFLKFDYLSICLWNLMLTNNLHGFFTGTGTIMWLTQWQRSNPIGYGNATTQKYVTLRLRWYHVLFHFTKAGFSMYNTCVLRD